MNLFTKLIHKGFCLLATGKVPKVGALFRAYRRHGAYTFFIYKQPNVDSQTQRVVLFNRDKASFLVLKCQEDVPLWNQWVKVLYSSYDPLSPKREETVIGWIDYLEFNQVVVAKWAQEWEEGENK